jgi:hypothetical protein
MGMGFEAFLRPRFDLFLLQVSAKSGWLSRNSSLGNAESSHWIVTKEMGSGCEDSGKSDFGGIRGAMRWKMSRITNCDRRFGAYCVV